MGVSWVTQRLGILAIRTGDERRGVRVLAATHEIGAPMLRGNVPELALCRQRPDAGELRGYSGGPPRGDLYYLPPGHTGVVEEDFECIEFSPPAAHEQVLDVVKRNATMAQTASA